MRAVMVKFFSLEADHSLRPPLPLQRGPSWRGSFELTGARVIRRSMPVTQLAPWTTKFLATEANPTQHFGGIPSMEEVYDLLLTGEGWGRWLQAHAGRRVPIPLGKAVRESRSKLTSLTGRDNGDE